MTESQLAIWFEVTCVISLLSNVSHIGSDQHTDLSDARMA